MEITMGHGAGGELMSRLISEQMLQKLMLKRVGKVGLEDLDDGASLTLGDKELVLTTDGHTVSPLFFPGGDIGKLAACGTINDVAVMGAEPLALASSIIMEEGFPSEDLERVITSMNAVCEETGVPIITGDTKVMERGAIDGMVITTTGIGIVKGEIIRDSGLKAGDKIILSGSVGDHGITLMSFREGFGFETALKSDIAPVWGMVEKAMDAGEIHAMKDPTRGGLAALLNELARKSKVGITVEEDRIPMKDGVIAASEMLGIDPLTVANEGKVIFGVKRSDAEKVLEAVRSMGLGKDAQIIGEVTKEYKGKVVIETGVGGKRYLEPPVGDPVPRVC